MCPIHDYEHLSGMSSGGKLYIDWRILGLLEQWLVEGNYTEEEALMQSCDMMAVGIDTVRKRLACLSSYSAYKKGETRPTGTFAFFLYFTPHREIEVLHLMFM